MAVSTPVRFYDAAASFDVAEQTVIMFAGHRFVWHSNGEEHERGDPCWPTVTLMVPDADNYAGERLATNQFLSAMSFTLNYPMSVITSAATGFKGELDPALLRQPSPSVGMIVTNAPTEITVESDQRLRLVLALFREGRSADSPFYRFLAYFNALDAGFE